MARTRLGNLKGPKGDRGERGPKGDPFTFADFTQEQLEKLKGPKGEDGKSATAETAYNALLSGNVWCKSAGVDDVLIALIGNIGKPFPRTDFRSLTINGPVQGNQAITITGEPHFKLSINNGPKRVFESDSMTVELDSTMKDKITINYYNLVDELVSTQQINLKESNGYDMGALSRIEELTGHEDNFTELAGKVAIYEKGVKFTPTALSVKDTDGEMSAMALGMLLEEFISTGGQDYYEIDLSKLPNNNAALPNEVPVNIVRNYRNVIIKVRKANVIGNSETIKLNGEDYQSIKINGSDLVETHRGSNYTYSFETDSITAD
jgi:conserved domain protein